MNTSVNKVAFASSVLLLPADAGIFPRRNPNLSPDYVMPIKFFPQLDAPGHEQKMRKAGSLFFFRDAKIIGTQ